MNHRQKALVFGLATVAIWSTVASAFKIALISLDPLQLLLVSSTISLLTLGAILRKQDKLLSILQIPKIEIARAALLGVLNPFLYYIVLFKAYDLLPAQEAQPLNYTWAITLSLLSIPLLKQKMSLTELIAILISYLGVVVISTHGNILSLKFTNPWGVSFALGSTIIWSLYWIFNARSQIDPIVGLFLNFFFGVPLILVATTLFSSLPTLNITSFISASYIGIFEMGVTYALWITALKFASLPRGGGTAAIASLIFLSPFLSLILIYFLVGEEIQISTIVGLLFIITGSALMQHAQKKARVSTHTS